MIAEKKEIEINDFKVNERVIAKRLTSKGYKKIDNQYIKYDKSNTEVTQNEKIRYDNSNTLVINKEDRYIIQRSQNTTLEIPNRGLTIINESGLYSLIFGSDLPKAKEFKRWVTSEVLPAIRKTGTYMTELKKKDDD